ncbi:MAG TPA: NYN domain-containing protein, partial [Gemmatimonadaceae bacterium]
MHHAPNAALLIDFDNVTMGIRSDLGNELRNLLSSDIVKGKVAVQRAYADWRRYPQYIVPLTESSIDLIFAPAYGSSKKNATDIRLAIDAMELVFTRPEIGTIILLSGDSDFSSLVIKLKEYGKYVIGVGIRESSSDLLVMNCDEYYSYNALAGLVKTNEEEIVKHDPWELVTEAIHRMKRNGDVMRSDRLKQVMQEIDSTFDEKNVGHAKFSRFCLEAAQRGLIRVNRLESGQLEVDVPEPAAPARAAPVAEAEEPAERGRRGRRGRGRGREREERPAEERAVEEMPRAAAPAIEPEVEARGDGRPRGRRD